MRISPTHLNDLENASNSSELNNVKINCQDDDICIYDTLATQNLSLGQTTKQINDGNLQMQEQLGKLKFVNICLCLSNCPNLHALANCLFLLFHSLDKSQLLYAFMDNNFNRH